MAATGIRCGGGDGSIAGVCAALPAREVPLRRRLRFDKPLMLKISHGFDAGAIETIAAHRADDIRVNIRADSHAEFRQWFFFRVQGVRDQVCRIRFENAGQCTYVDGWQGYRAVASYDRRQWFRVPTSFDGSKLEIVHTADRDCVWYAYFEPYSWERHLDLLGRVEDSPLARVRDLGNTVEGRDVNLVTV